MFPPDQKADGEVDAAAHSWPQNCAASAAMHKCVMAVAHSGFLSHLIQLVLIQLDHTNSCFVCFTFVMI